MTSNHWNSFDLHETYVLVLTVYVGSTLGLRWVYAWSKLSQRRVYARLTSSFKKLLHTISKSSGTLSMGSDLEVKILHLQIVCKSLDSSIVSCQKSHKIKNEFLITYIM